LSQENASILYQLHTGKCRLNSYLKTINVADTNFCETCHQVESITHFLFNCHRWNNERCKLLVAAYPMRWGDLSHFLGSWSRWKRPDGVFIDGKYQSWRPNKIVVSATIAFAKKTGHLSQDPEP